MVNPRRSRGLSVCAALLISSRCCNATGRKPCFATRRREPMLRTQRVKLPHTGPFLIAQHKMQVVAEIPHRQFVGYADERALALRDLIETLYATVPCRTEH